MNRFHVHIRVDDLDANLRFYSQLFGAAPSVSKHDYAKWMLDDPALNFAISTGSGNARGIAHLGLQADSDEGLQRIGDRLKAADAVNLAEADTTCCYARSDKYWTEDPQGLRWEAFHTHSEATTHLAQGPKADTDGCCDPHTPQGVCCPPKPGLAADAPCCG